MKITHVLSASVIAGTVLLSTTGCFFNDNASNTAPSAEIGVTASATATPSATETATEAPVAEETEPVSPETEEAVAEEKDPEPASNGTKNMVNVENEMPLILSAVNGFYDYTEKETSLDELMEAGQIVQKQGELTADEAKAIVAAAPEGFKYFDTSTPENVRNAYNELTATAMGVKAGGSPVTFNVSVEAVSYNGDTAAVDKNAVEVSVDGEVQPVFPGEENNLNLVKKDGSWLIVASPNGR